MENSSSSPLDVFSHKLPGSAYLFEDKDCIVFEEDFNPQALIHFLVVPKKIISSFTGSVDDEKILGHLILVARKIAMEKGLQNTGYHVMVDEDFRSSRFRCLHVFGRALHHMMWPVGPGSRL